jgi:hypothetical protein
MASSTPLVAAGAGVSTPISVTEVVLPNDKSLKHAARISIENDKPIMLDYYNDTREGKAFLGEDPVTKEKMLVRSEEEYTSLIQKVLRAGDDKIGYDFITITENSVYIIAGNTKKKNISSPTS